MWESVRGKALKVFIFFFNIEILHYIWALTLCRSLGSADM